MFQIRAKTETHCASYVVNVTADDTDELENGCQCSVYINPLRRNNDLSQTSHCNIKSVSVSEVMRIENMITQVKFY